MARRNPKQKGGQRFDRFISTAKRMRPYPTIEVGFLDSQIAPLAFIHEHGSAKAYLPSRPAFGSSLDWLVMQCNIFWKKPSNRPYRYNKATGAMATDIKAFERLAEVLAKHVRYSYHAFEGAPLSAWQRERKEGTPGADDQLVGHRGPRMIEHISWRLS